MPLALKIVRFRLCAAGAALVVASATAGVSAAAVVAIANKTAAPVVVNVLVEGEAPRQLKLEPADCRPVFAGAPVSVQFGAGSAARALEPDCAYTISQEGSGAPEFSKLPLGEAPLRAWPRSSAIAGLSARAIDVKILVDEDERRPRAKWEPALRARIAAASEILVAHGGAPLRVVAVGQWDSDNQETDFHRSLAEFEKEVTPAPAQLAIGFSSQYEAVKGRIHLGGTRGALHTHILLKERAGHVLDPERLELLVHELGHLMGATHSEDPNSVMRPVVGQGQLRLAGAKIHFDAANTLLISLLGQEIRERGIRSLSDASPGVRQRMAEIYKSLNGNLPDDTSTGNYLALLNNAAVEPLLKDTRHVLAQIVRVAKIERDRRASAKSSATGPAGAPAADADGDQLLEYYVRQAALAAKQVRRENGPRAVLLALGVALDDQGALRKLPLATTAEDQLEGVTQRAERIAAMGQPTMRGRADLAKHFFVSAHLVVLLGSDAAQNAGTVKEILDANGGSGFSFRDMTADRAGVMFARAVLSGALSLDDVAQRFAVDTFMPPLDDLREDMQIDEFVKSYGSTGDQRFAAELARIDARIMSMPVYNAATADAAAAGK